MRQVTLDEVYQLASDARQAIWNIAGQYGREPKIYLHWSAGRYDTCFDDYHINITGDGSIKLVLHNDNINNVSNPCSSANNSNEAAFAHYNGSTYRSLFNNNYDDNAYTQIVASSFTSLTLSFEWYILPVQILW